MPKFFEIGVPVPEKKISKVFFTIYGHGGHLGHVTLIIYIYSSAIRLLYGRQL